MEQQGPGHKPRLADTLDAASRRGFIGRSAELETFEALLARPDHVSVLWLSGLGGVGKTALMQACAGRARQAGWVPGFIGWVGIVIAERLYTLTLWEDPDTIRQLRASAQHKAAARQVFETDFGAAMHTGVWVPEHLNPQWQRCPKCGTMIDPDRTNQYCPCGEPSPARRTYV